MSRTESITGSLGAALIMLLNVPAAGAGVVLVSEGQPQAAIVVDAAVMAPDIPRLKQKTDEYDEEQLRIRVRESVNDLAAILGRMSGAKIEILTAAPAGGIRPIYVGAAAEQVFGKVGAHDAAGQGFRIVVTPGAVGLFGESPLATSYAIYELLERLGCRWYLPGNLGECIPERKTIDLPETDESIIPGTLVRALAGMNADDAFIRRTRMGGFQLRAQHALETHLPKENLAAHPDWYVKRPGAKNPYYRVCWGTPEVADAIADAIVARLDDRYIPSISLSPNDGLGFCDCPKCRALDTGDIDPSCGLVSLTDRYLHFVNRIAARVTKKYPDVLFGFLVYGPISRLPLREVPHPNLIPQIAPITYCRAHTMLQTNACPSRALIRPILEGWGKTCGRVSYYNYMFHLAETSAPYPMIKQMSDELPLLYANRVLLWQPETLANLESVLPGHVLAMRMAWNPGWNPAGILDEFYTRYYGSAAQPMRHYWERVDQTWTGNPEHAGSGWGYGRRFPPETVKAFRTALDQALAACKTDMERRRVTLQDESLKQFELFMKLRRDLSEGRLADLAADGERWLARQVTLAEEYKDHFCFTRVRWAKQTISGHYFDLFYKATYDAASRVARDYLVITPPLRAWRYQVDREDKGESLGWQNAAFDDAKWPVTDPCMDTWFDHGIETYYGKVFYRTTVKMPAVPPGRKIFLWLSSTDGGAKVFVNGRHVPFVNEAGESSEWFPHTSYGKPAVFDITSAVKPGADNQVTIAATHPTMNELGSGGLIGPVFVYREKP
jgi:hypothetical protein